MRHPWRTTLIGMVAVTLVAAFWFVSAQETTLPRLADGTPNLGRVPGEKGVWNVPYIQNMAMRAIGPDGKPLAPGGGGRRGGGPGPAGEGAGPVGRGGAKSEPWIPFMPWAASVYDYNSANESKYDPEGYCLPPGGPRCPRYPPSAMARAKASCNWLICEAMIWGKS